ncbi:MAG: MurR/RpiR family transcriptional regulator [Anaerovoracaceae bacterium]
MKDNIKEKIINNWDRFSIKEKRVAKFVVDNYEQITAMSSQELALKAEVSDTTVIRFSQSIGYKGYLTFKKDLKKEVLSKKSPYEVLKTMEKTNDVVVEKYKSTILNDSNDFLGKLDLHIVDEVVEEILSARKVYVVGAGSDRSVAMYLYNYLPLVGIDTVAIMEEGVAMRALSMEITKDDLVIMSSFPTIRTSEEWIAEYCKNIGTKLIALTDSQVTAKILNAKYFIKTGRSENAFFNSCILSMMVCEIILLKITERNPEQVSERLKLYHELVFEE